MKKIVSIFLLLISIMVLCSCNSDAPSESQIGYELALEVLRCLDEEDTESLKSLFCEEIQNTHNLDEEIKEAMEYYDGKTVEYSNIQIGGGDSMRDGKIVKLGVVPVVRNIETDAQRKYKIAIHSYLIYEEKQNLVGITYINIIDEDSGVKFQIGEVIN